MTTTIDFTSRTFGCEAHEAPGACTEECLTIAYATMGYSESVPFDPTGCSYPPPMPEYGPVLDPESRGIMWAYTHPEDCQCGTDECPVMIEEREYIATANYWPTTRRDGTSVTVYAYPDGNVVESTRPLGEPFGPIVAMNGRML
jgi:hypothetical protein